MTVRVERVFELPVPPEEVWSFISDPERRAGAISVVDRFEVTGEHTATWHVRLPVPYVDATIEVETEEVRIEEPRYVKFLGRSRAMRVIGEHEIAPSDSGSRITNRFVVEGRLPGVERYFKKNLDSELSNLESALEAEYGSVDDGPGTGDGPGG